MKNKDEISIWHIFIWIKWETKLKKFLLPSFQWYHQPTVQWSAAKVAAARRIFLIKVKISESFHTMGLTGLGSTTRSFRSQDEPKIIWPNSDWYKWEANSKKKDSAMIWIHEVPNIWSRSSTEAIRWIMIFFAWWCPHWLAFVSILVTAPAAFANYEY